MQELQEQHGPNIWANRNATRACRQRVTCLQAEGDVLLAVAAGLVPLNEHAKAIGRCETGVGVG